MIRVFVIAFLLFGAACVPSEEQEAAETKAAAERTASDAAAAAYNACVAEGGDIIHITDPGSFSCQPEEDQKQRQRNLAARAFEKKCNEAGGSTWENNDEARTCVARVQDYMHSCKTSSDCSGSCMKLYMMEPRGFCGPARPLLGCFTEWGSSKPNKKICAE